MTKHSYRPHLLWHDGELPIETLAKLGRVLGDWQGTPYESGQRFKGRAADCIGAVFGVFDELDGRVRAVDPQMPQDVAMHSRSSAVAAMRALLRIYAPVKKLRTVAGAATLVHPGDLVITGPLNGGPGHIAMVGPRRNELWHATAGPGFHQSGWSLTRDQVLHAVFRPQEKFRWI